MKIHGFDDYTYSYAFIYGIWHVPYYIFFGNKNYPSCPKTQAFEALGSEAKAGMWANKTLRDEMALQEVG